MLKRTMLGAMLIGFVGAIWMPAALAETNAVRTAGQLTKIDGKTLTIAPSAGQETVITCDDATKISRDGGQATFGDLQVGKQIRAYYGPADHLAKAVIIAKDSVEPPPPATIPTRVAGQLTKIDGKTLTITTDGKETVITCNDATKIGRDGGKATFGDLQVGLPVRTYYSKSDNVASAVFIAKATAANTKP